MERVVITGMGAITPVGNDVPSFWESLKTGKCGIGPITKFDVSNFKVKLGAESRTSTRPSIWRSVRRAVQTQMCITQWRQRFRLSSRQASRKAISIPIARALSSARDGTWRAAMHAVFEILSNSIDEAREGHGTEIVTTRYADGSIEVADHGRGIPIEWNENEQRYNWELVFCELYAGGKYKNDTGENYEFSLGLNGLGTCATQYSSEYMDVTVIRDGFEYGLHFEKGENKTGTKEATPRRRRTRAKPARPSAGSPIWRYSRISTSLWIIIWIRSSGRRSSTAISSLC